MSKVSCEAAGKHRRCDFANGAAELLAGQRRQDMSKVSCEAAIKHRRCDFANGAAELVLREQLD